MRLGTLIFAVVCLGTLGPATAGPAGGEPDRTPARETPPAAKAGMRVYRDPETGKLTVPPPGARMAPVSPATSPPAQALKNGAAGGQPGYGQPFAVPGGGTAVRLPPGRFPAVRARRNDRGEVEVVHPEKSSPQAEKHPAP